MYALAQTVFTPSFAPIRGTCTDVLPAQRNGRPFSFTLFNTPAPVAVTTESAQVIVERNGIFCITDLFEPSPVVALDLDFKELVDDVMNH